MFDLDEDELRRAATRMSEAANKIQKRMINEAMFGERPPYSPFVSTARMASSVAPKPFRSFVPLFDVITNPFVVKMEKRSKKMEMGFWRRLWQGLIDLNQWPYSPIQFYEVEKPAIMIDKLNNRIICHPSLENEIKQAIQGGKYANAK